MNFLLVQDSKVFVDMPLLHTVEDVINNFESLPDRNKVVKQKKNCLSLTDCLLGYHKKFCWWELLSRGNWAWDSHPRRLERKPRFHKKYKRWQFQKIGCEDEQCLEELDQKNWTNQRRDWKFKLFDLHGASICGPQYWKV